MDAVAVGLWTCYWWRNLQLYHWVHRACDDRTRQRRNMTATRHNRFSNRCQLISNENPNCCKIVAISMLMWFASAARGFVVKQGFYLFHFLVMHVKYSDSRSFPIFWGLQQPDYSLGLAWEKKICLTVCNSVRKLKSNEVTNWNWIIVVSLHLPIHGAHY